MRLGLAMAATVPLFAATAAHAQIAGSGLLADEVARVASARALDLRLAEEQTYSSGRGPLRGMLVHQDVAPNAVIGLGLAKMYARRKSSVQSSPAEPVTQSRRPAVTFVLKF